LANVFDDGHKMDKFATPGRGGNNVDFSLHLEDRLKDDQVGEFGDVTV